jgi:hypothetical protein
MPVEAKICPCPRLAAGNAIMSKHIITASDLHPTQVRYFLGYKDDGEFYEVLWTFDPWQARWIDAAEAAVETDLLAALCPSYCLEAWSLDAVGTSKGR